MFLKKIFGTSSTRYIKKVFPLVQTINDLYDGLSDKTDQELIDKTAELKKFVKDARESARAEYENNLDKNELKKKVLEHEQKALDSIMPEAFAMVKETCRRMVGKSFRVSGQNADWNMIPYDVQLLGAIVLHNGKVSEMKTGEGKTLTIALAAYLNSLNEEGVHIVTVNDYLAKRDCQEMGKVYEFLGLSAGYISNEQNDEQIDSSSKKKDASAE